MALTRNGNQALFYVDGNVVFNYTSSNATEFMQLPSQGLYMCARAACDESAPPAAYFLRRVQAAVPAHNPLFSLRRPMQRL